MGEIDAMKVVDDALTKLDDDARGRVLSWASSKFGKKLTPSDDQSQVSNGAPHPAKAAKAAAKKAKNSKKMKSIISMDKSLNLSPSGKISATEFASEKSPTNVKQKCVVACYYLRNIVSVETVTVSGVNTFFKTVAWKVPNDLRNTLQQAGSEGWLDTADSEDIKITSMGENLIEHDLPPTKG